MEFGVASTASRVSTAAASALDRTVDEMFDTLLENGAYSRTLRQWDNVKGRGRRSRRSKQALQKAIGLSRWSITSAPPAVRTVRRLQPSAQRCERRHRYRTQPHRQLLYLAGYGGFLHHLLKADDDTLALWDAPVHTPALNWGK
jgi:dihydroxyacetone kinase-like protein